MVPQTSPSRFGSFELDQEALDQATARQKELTKPEGSLGHLERLAARIAAIQGSDAPRVRPAETLIFAADHPVTVHGVSAFPAAVTPAMVMNILAGGAASSVLAKLRGVPLTVIDVGVSNLHDIPESPHASYRRAPNAAGGDVGDLRVGQAMTEPTFEAAIEAGISAVDTATASGMLLVGELGIGNTTAAAAVSAALLNHDAERMTGPGTGVANEALQTKRQVVREAVKAVGQADAETVLRRIGGRDLAAMYGAMGRALQKRIPVLVDGFVVGAAALALCKTMPGAAQGLIFGHRSHEPGHAYVLNAMQAEGLLHLGMRLGEASGALTAFGLAEAACALHNEMATFADAEVPNRTD